MAPPGAGKSWILAGIAQALNEPILVLQPNREILMQNKRKMESYGFRPDVFSASVGRREVGADVVLGTIGSLAERKGKKGRASMADYFADYRHILIDECHLCGAKEGQYRSFFDELADTKLLGLTGTPFRLTSNSEGSQLKFLTRTRPRIFSEVVAWVQANELFDAGYLCPMEYYRLGKGIDRSEVGLNSTGADFDDKSLQLHLFKIGFNDQVVEVALRLLKAGRENLLVFVRFVKDAQVIASQIPNAAVVTADTKTAERQAIGEAFKNGEIRTVVNCGVYLLGFDHPRLETVLDAAHSLSLARVYQKWGRAARPHKDKKSAWIVDMCGGYNLFGRIQDLRMYCAGNTKWFFAGRPGGPKNKEVTLTNVILNGGTGGVRCKDCLSSDVFWMRHSVTGNSALLCRAPVGTKPNITLTRTPENKTVYTILKPADSGYDKCEFVVHRAVCRRTKTAA